MRPEPLPFRIYGAEQIGEGAMRQMKTAARLPITVAAALMPDAHQGYGLPIGGVLAAENAVIPYGVGVDIGCRMCLSIFAVPDTYLERYRRNLKQILLENTTFGTGMGPEKPLDDPIFDRDEFESISFVKNLREKARLQIGSSGTGNHFVEFGMVKITENDPKVGLSPGTYLGLLSHSGSRGLGANIANFYTKKAMETCRLPKEAKHLAWLSLDSQAGAEYWAAMTLAGDYASACHHHIHRKIIKSLGEKPTAIIENHHNFAWKETLVDGRQFVVHRKGATPAGKGVLGIIPGSMTAPGFIVRGRGKTDSLFSAAHGAGRQMSRRKAMESIGKKELRQELEKHGLELTGGGLDEAPGAYKNIERVMKNQQDLVDVLGIFLPKIVRMAD